MCGEKIVDGFHRYTVMGSPLRVRGKVAQDRGHAVRAGITPARAGKSVYIDSISQPARDHPRLCGEKKKSIIGDVGFAGSPPPVRGKGFPRSPQAGQRRITPARAGKRRPSHVYSQPFWDHPCLCREKICYEAPEDEKNGSPPPMRGKAVHKGLYRPALRITPAHAGKSGR